MSFRLTLLLFTVVVTTGAVAEGAAQVADLPVIGVSATTFSRFYAHLTSKNRDLDEYYARRLYDSYQAECLAEGVSPVVALSQMIHETNYLLFTGSVDATQYNYAGMGSTAVGVPGINFGTMDRGIRAHVQHLKAYGDTEPLSGDLVDPRFHFVVRGSAPTVMALAGRWATDPDYGPKLLAHISRLIVTPAGP